jgi:hypothetical protein
VIKLEQEVFVQTSMASKQRRLHPAKAIEINENEVTIVSSDPDFRVETDQTIRVFHQARDFMQQTANVISMTEEDGVKTVAIVLTSKPASAESREFHRVSTVFAELTASVGEEDACPLVDVSTMGFALISKEAFQIGDILSTELRFEHEVYPGKTCVQSVRDLGAGRIRYGLLPLADDVGGTQMFAGMQRMTIALERRQLRRLSGVV